MGHARGDLRLLRRLLRAADILLGFGLDHGPTAGLGDGFARLDLARDADRLLGGLAQAGIDGDTEGLSGVQSAISSGSRSTPLNLWPGRAVLGPGRARRALPTLRDRAVERLGNRLVTGVLTITASEHRSQLRNREAAEARLASVVAAAIAPPPRRRRATKPTRGSVERRIADKKRRAQVKRGRGGDFD